MFVIQIYLVNICPYKGWSMPLVYHTKPANASVLLLYPSVRVDNITSSPTRQRL